MQTLGFNELGEKYLEEMKARVLADETMMLELDVASAASVFAFLQLALRLVNPTYNESAVIVRRVALMMQAQLNQTPAVAEACRRGWLEQFDVEETNGND